MKSVIVYWSGTGNTEMMAGLIQKGLENKGALRLGVRLVASASPPA